MKTETVIISLLFVASFGLGTFAVQNEGWSLPEYNSEVQPKDKPPVVLISLESVRAENVGSCYSYERETAPSICGVAEDGVLFENAYSQGTATTIAIPSLVTGDLPISVARNDIGNPVLAGALTLPEILEKEGYETSGFFDTVQGEFIDSPLVKGLDSLNPWKNGNRSQVIPTIKRHGESFTWIFARDTTHKPYTPDPEFRRWDNLTSREYRTRGTIDSYSELNESFLTTEDMRDLYDEAILTEDARIGEVLAQMKEKGVYEKSMIIITGDHGDSLGEQGRMGHGDNPVEEQIRVPLVIKFPDNRYAGSRVEESVRHMDVLPTILELIGVSNEEDVEGKPLQPLINGEKDRRKPISATYPSRTYAISAGDYRLEIDNIDAVCRDGEKPVLKMYELPENSRIGSLNQTVQETRSQLKSSLCDSYESGYGRRIMNLNTAEADDVRFSNQNNSEEILVSPHPANWYTYIDGPPKEVLTPSFCQKAQLALGESLSPIFRVCVNDGGFRDRGYSVEKPEDTFRIAALGDAVTFGVGVNASQTWTTQLEKQFNSTEEHNRSFQVLNFGLPFKSTSEEVQFFRYVNGTEYDPDLLVLQYMENDAQNLSRVNEIADNLKTNLSGELSSREKERKAMKEAINVERRERKQMSIDEEMEAVVPYLDRLENLSEAHDFEILVMYYATESSKQHVAFMKRAADRRDWYFMVSELENSYTFGSNYNLNPSGHKKTAQQLKQKISQDIMEDPN